MKLKLAAALVAGATLAAGAASASILASVADNSFGAGNWQNQGGDQNFLVQFTLASAAQVTGFDIDTVRQFGALGQPVIIRIRNDVAGEPAGGNLFEFSDGISSRAAAANGQDILVGAQFDAISLAAGTYWIGMSGTDSELGWSSYDYGVLVSPDVVQLAGELPLTIHPPIRNLGFEVLGTMAGVPEPASWILMLAGFLGAGAAIRGRRRTVLAA